MPELTPSEISFLLNCADDGRRSIAVLSRAFRSRFGRSISGGAIRKALVDFRRREREYPGEQMVSRMGRAGHEGFLPNHRGPQGVIDWENVPGYVSWKEEARLAAREAIRGTVGT